MKFYTDRISKNPRLWVLGAALGVVGLAGAAMGQGAETLTVVAWGGSAQDAHREAYWKPYAQKYNVKIQEDTWNGELAKLRAMVESKNVSWDLLVADYWHAIQGCEQGLLEKVNFNVIDNSPGFKEDFLPGTLHECGLPVAVFSWVWAYDDNRIPAAWGDKRPATIADIFDTKKFPGKRAIRRDGKMILEWALMADGVPKEKVYDLLRTNEGVSRALAKLDTIKSDIVWYTANPQGVQLLADGEVVLAAQTNGRLNAANQQGRKFTLMWDGHIYAVDIMIVPKGPRSKEAMKMLAFEAKSEVQANFAKYITYGPARKSAMQYIDRALWPQLPTSPENLKTAIPRNEEWYADYFEEVRTKFNAWLAK